MGDTSIRHAERSKNVARYLISLTMKAGALHQAAEPARAQALFEQAEALQAKDQPSYPLLYSFRGYQYCDLLLTLGCPAEVRERTLQTLQWATQGGLRPLTIGLDHISLGRAALTLGDFCEASAQLREAVGGLRRAGDLMHLPRGLLARAALLRETRDFPAARRDLEEVMRIARRSEMRLFQRDAHLEFARLALEDGDKAKAREHLAEARRLVEETGYGHRRPEVKELAVALS